ncbi:hypothetical protein X777_10897 [Ooceraea biroi]|uniref:Uncharacterized protein n=1 Tax=Ooceraea biroi TaxID=2015173 RepID=A0A026W4M5_OOCBI|nr:hypothetical protein X777_10897 [Ooceraea biroi]
MYGWGIEAIEEFRRNGVDVESLLRERDYEVQRQEEENRIGTARYNKRYRIMSLGTDQPHYLRAMNMNKESNGSAIRALVGLRCGNMEEENKY